MGGWLGYVVMVLKKSKDSDSIKLFMKEEKTQHQNPEFGHKQTEIYFFNLFKSALPFNFCDKLSSSCLDPLFPFS
jgi:hypothetical protein